MARMPPAFKRRTKAVKKVLTRTDGIHIALAPRPIAHLPFAFVSPSRVHVHVTSLRSRDDTLRTRIPRCGSTKHGFQLHRLKLELPTCSLQRRNAWFGSQRHCPPSLNACIASRVLFHRSCIQNPRRPIPSLESQNLSLQLQKPNFGLSNLRIRSRIL